MRIDNLITREYPVVDYYSGVTSVEAKLAKNNYLIVIDDHENFKGVLTPGDLGLRPYKVVADCLVHKDILSIDDTLLAAMEAFERNNAVALPVFDNENFKGVLEKQKVFTELQKEAKALYHKSVSTEKVKNNFLENLSHEIRTPLNGIIGFIELLEENYGQDALVDKESAHKVIKECSNKFLKTMQNLIELAFIQSGIKECFKILDIHIDVIFDDVEKFYSLNSHKYGDKTKILFIRDDNNPCLNTDKEVLTEILFHLINNTITLFGNTPVYVGYILPEGCDYIILYVSNNYLSDKDQCLNLFVKSDQSEVKPNLNADGLGISMILVREYCLLINAAIKTETGFNTNTYYCRVPLASVEE